MRQVRHVPKQDRAAAAVDGRARAGGGARARRAAAQAHRPGAARRYADILLTLRRAKLAGVT